MRKFHDRLAKKMTPADVSKAEAIAAVFGVVALLAKSDDAVTTAGNGVKALYLALGIALMSSILHRLL